MPTGFIGSAPETTTDTLQVDLDRTASRVRMVDSTAVTVAVGAQDSSLSEDTVAVQNSRDHEAERIRSQRRRDVVPDAVAEEA